MSRTSASNGLDWDGELCDYEPNEKSQLKTSELDTEMIVKPYAFKQTNTYDLTMTVPLNLPTGPIQI